VTGDCGLQGAGDGGLRVMRLAGQPAGREIGEEVGTHKEVAEVTEAGDGGLRVTCYRG
jgi:hypothetical protein